MNEIPSVPSPRAFVRNRFGENVSPDQLSRNNVDPVELAGELSEQIGPDAHMLWIEAVPKGNRNWLVPAFEPRLEWKHHCAVLYCGYVVDPWLDEAVPLAEYGPRMFPKQAIRFEIDPGKEDW